MKKILIIAPSSIYGGGEVYVKNLINYINKNYIIIVGACNERLINEINNNVNFIFKVKPSTSQANKLYNNLLINYYSFKYNVDIIFLNGLPESALYAFTLLKKNIVCIGHSNESHLRYINDQHGLKNFLLKTLFKLSFKKLKLFIAINEQAKSNLLYFFPKYKKSQVIYNGVPEMVIEKKKNNNFTVGRICRLLPDKNVKLAIDSMKNINKASLIIAGEGPEKNKLEEHANRSKIDVTFLGHCNAADFFSKIDVMLLTTPSNSDGDATPLVILESMSAGIPVISTKVGGVPELIEHMVTGILCEDTPESFSNAINLLLHDEMLYQTISHNSRNAYIERFSSNITFEQTLSAINKHTSNN
ncbi:glycosyltransferase family 4 protein [Providencia rettgeri]|nr:glycosyltransferase family 4 protein [Providencia rettgeri]NHN53136.1 glycosyltransferase family 4 protein [Providencia rettgeri]